MKVRLTFKDPDRYVNAEGVADHDNVPAEAKALVGRFVEFDEYVSIEFDTQTQTATVLPT